MKHAVGVVDPDAARLESHDPGPAAVSRLPAAGPGSWHSRALASGVYDADRVFHPAYDDFSETAFCCGGLYLARRSLWNLVRQNEALFHCEWEDISFGLECQRRGLPHRVNPFLVAESTTPHPLLLTRLHTIGASGAERGRLHVSPEQQAAARSGSAAFKPIVVEIAITTTKPSVNVSMPSSGSRRSSGCPRILPLAAAASLTCGRSWNDTSTACE